MIQIIIIEANIDDEDKASISTTVNENVVQAVVAELTKAEVETKDGEEEEDEYQIMLHLPQFKELRFKGLQSNMKSS